MTARSRCHTTRVPLALLNMETTTIELTRHAVTRFHERIRPALTPDAAADVLSRIMEHGELTNQPPAWFADRARQTADQYLLIDDIILPLLNTGSGHYCAVTCIARGGISDKARARRNARRQARARRRRR